MASTNKTPQLGLNQWAAGDEVLRADFNADNAKIEGLAGRGACVTGTYTGAGAGKTVVTLGFQPRFLLLAGPYATSSYGMGLVFPDICYIERGNGLGNMGENAIALTSTGFRANSSWFSDVGIKVNYVAFY